MPYGPREVRGTFTINAECKECLARETHATVGMPVIYRSDREALEDGLFLAEGGRGSMVLECAGCGRTVKFNDVPIAVPVDDEEPRVSGWTQADPE